MERNFHIKGTPQFNEVKMGDIIENCITVEVRYEKNRNPKGYYLVATKHSYGIDEHGGFYTDIFDFSCTRVIATLAKEAGRRGAKAEAEANAIFEAKAEEMAKKFGVELD